MIFPNDNEDIDLENPIVQSMMFTELFHSLQECDSKRVDDFWAIIDDTVLEFLNRDDRNKGS